jgi:hypothetical protein
MENRCSEDAALIQPKKKNKAKLKKKHRVHLRPDQAPANGQREKASNHDIHNQSVFFTWYWTVGLS